MYDAEPMMLIRPAHTAGGQLPHPLQRQKANCLRCGNKRSLHIPLHQREAIAKAVWGGGTFRGIIVRGNINLYAAIIALAFSNGKEKLTMTIFLELWTYLTNYEHICPREISSAPVYAFLSFPYERFHVISLCLRSFRSKNVKKT